MLFYQVRIMDIVTGANNGCYSVRFGLWTLWQEHIMDVILSGSDYGYCGRNQKWMLFCEVRIMDVVAGTNNGCYSVRFGLWTLWQEIIMDVIL